MSKLLENINIRTLVAQLEKIDPKGIPTPTYLSDVTLGCDPEFFLWSKSLKCYVPAHETGITGTKEKPTPLKAGGAVQVDGLALEFNIKPTSSPVKFVSQVINNLSEIRELVDPDLEFRFVPSVDFKTFIFNEVPEKYKELGCDPDFSADTKLEKTPPPAKAKDPFRCAGGHFHFGFIAAGLDNPFDPNHIWDCSAMVTSLESHFSTNWTSVVLPYLSTRNQHETLEARRRDLYGQRGSFRPKTYGFEWRTPSNYWLNHTPYSLISHVNNIKLNVLYSLIGGHDSYILNKLANEVYTKDSDIGKFFSYRAAASDTYSTLANTNYSRSPEHLEYKALTSSMKSIPAILEDIRLTKLQPKPKQALIKKKKAIKSNHYTLFVDNSAPKSPVKSLKKRAG